MLNLWNLTGAAPRRRLLEELLASSGGSFSTVYEALNAAAAEKKGAEPLDKRAVLRHISRLAGAARSGE